MAQEGINWGNLEFNPGVAGQGGMNFGNLKISPGMAGQVVYDDNIFLKNGSNNTTQAKVSDWIYHTQPSLLLNYTLPERGFVNMGYRGDWAFYNDNTGNNWKNNQGFLAVDYKSPTGLIVKIDDLLVNAEDPYGSADQYNIGRVTKRWYNDLKSQFGYLFTDRFRTFVYYNFFTQSYKDDQDASQNYYDNEVGFGVEAKFLPKTWAFLRYYYGKRDFFANSIASNVKANADWQRTNAGLTWDASAKLTGEVNFGYQWKSYDNLAISTGGQRDKNVNTWIAATSLYYKPLETTTVALTIARTPRDVAADTGEYFEDTGIGLSLRQIMLRRFTLKLAAIYSRNDYTAPAGSTDYGRKDDNYQVNVGMDYKPNNWLTLGLDYWYNEKTSNISDVDFKDNRIIASVKLVY